MELMGQSRMTVVQFPAMRDEVIAALESLSDAEYQHRWWGRSAPNGGIDSLDVSIHALYDDSRVLPDPRSAVPAVLRAEDVALVADLGAVLTPVLDELGDAPDRLYLAHPRWAEVVAAARRALDQLMEHASDSLN